ncbi:AAA family ATPase [Massilia phyllosphaerae]|uniref:AAA family ATPase n=1 Tax=Massilia phyllosphaerae TaxID=3106034 RepID=UPI002B1CB05F|nr:ATP-binding protein [Massilia sp. SGZ-792]
MTPTLHFMCGKMAAGKSTLSRQLAAQHGAVLICEDIWLQQLYPTEIRGFDDYLAYARRLKAVVAPHVLQLLRAGVSVVLDFPANVPAQRAWFRSLLNDADAGFGHVLHFVDTPRARCIEQLHQRNRDKPPGSMAMSVEQFEAISALFVPPAPEEGFTVRTYR